MTAASSANRRASQRGTRRGGLASNGLCKATVEVLEVPQVVQRGHIARDSRVYLDDPTRRSDVTDG